MWPLINTKSAGDSRDLISDPTRNAMTAVNITARNPNVMLARGGAAICVAISPDGDLTMGLDASILDIDVCRESQRPGTVREVDVGQ